MKKFITLFCAVATLVACSKDDDIHTDDIPKGMGTATFAVSPQTAIITRAAENQVELSTLGVDVPTADQMQLTITPPEGGYANVPDAPFSYSGTVGEYNGVDYRDARKRYIPASDQPYVATLAWGNAEEEGVNKAYFESRNADGGKEQGFTVTARGNNEVTMTAKMVKAIVRINFTDQFKGYFANGAEMTLSTAAGATFKVGYKADGTAENVGTPFFVLAGEGKTFAIDGKATKQRPTANIDPQTITFTTVGRNGTTGQEVAEQTIYTYTFDVVDANYVTVTVDVNNEPLGEEIVGTEELNDDSVMDN